MENYTVIDEIYTKYIKWYSYHGVLFMRRAALERRLGHFVMMRPTMTLKMSVTIRLKLGSRLEYYASHKSYSIT